MITVAIVNYNTTDHLGACLAALQEAVTVPYEVVIVDNASSDGDLRGIVDAHPRVRLIANPVNRYYPPAANQAWRAGTGEAVLFLGTDVRVQRGTLESMQSMLAGGRYGAVTCQLVNPNGDIESGARAALTPAVFLYNFTLVGRLLRRRRDAINARQEYQDWDRRSDRDIDSCSGSCVMVRRDVLERFGGYDERFKLYFLEDDLCLKIRRAGLRIRFLGERNNTHERHASVRRENAARIRGIWRTDARVYVRLHFGRAVAGALIAAMVLTEAARSLQGVLASVGITRPVRSWWQEERRAPGIESHRES